MVGYKKTDTKVGFFSLYSGDSMLRVKVGLVVVFNYAAHIALFQRYFSHLKKVTASMSCERPDSKDYSLINQCQKINLYKLKIAG